MGYDLHDLIGDDGELQEPLPPRKKKPRDPNYWRNLFGAVVIEVLLGILVTFVALLLFGNSGSSPSPTPTVDAAQTRTALLIELTLTAIAEWTDTPTSTATPTATLTPSDTPSATITHAPTETDTPPPPPTDTPTPSYHGITRDSAPNVIQVARLDGHTTWVYALAWSPDGTQLASAGQFEGQESIWIWDVQKREILRQFAAHDDRILSLSWSGDFIASGGADNSVRVWSSEGRAVKRFDFAKQVECVAWSPDASMLAAVSVDGTLALWHMPGGGEALGVNAGRGSLTCVTWSPDGSQFATIGGSDQVRVYDADGTEIRTMEGPARSGAEVVWSPDGRLIVTRAETSSLQAWNAEGGNQVGGWDGRDPAWSPDSALLAGNLSRDMYIWDMADDSAQFGEVLAQLTGHTGSISAVAWSSDGRWIASSGEDRTIRIWGIAP